MTKDILKIAAILKKQKVPMLGITSEGENKLASIVNYSLRTATAEKKLLSHKIDNIASQVAVKYILDILYACLFQEDYEKNLAIFRKNEMYLEENDVLQKSSNLADKL